MQQRHSKANQQIREVLEIIGRKRDQITAERVNPKPPVDNAKNSTVSTCTSMAYDQQLSGARLPSRQRATVLIPQ